MLGQEMLCPRLRSAVPADRRSTHTPTLASRRSLGQPVPGLESRERRSSVDDLESLPETNGQVRGHSGVTLHEDDDPRSSIGTHSSATADRREHPGQVALPLR
jgi:hypothetical protein